MSLDHDHTWSPRKALEEQVAKEDLLSWARRDDARFKIIPPLKAEKWPAAPLHAFRSQLRQLMP